MATLAHRADLKMAAETLAAIEAAVVKQADDGLRQHFGASLIGRSCARALWYGFRWAKRPAFDGQMYRLFARGQREEDTFNKLLADAGIKVMPVDPATGRQFNFKAHGGHFGGSMDGAATGVPEAPMTPHVVEYKTHGAKSFAKLTGEGVQGAKPEHYAQMQCYMAWSGMTRALYVAVNKDTDALHIERIDFDRSFAEALMTKAANIIFAGTPPEGISTDPSWYECKLCDYTSFCHGTDVPLPTCRSCAHSTPETSGVWSCAKVGKDSAIPADFQKLGCDAHRFIPILLAKFAEPVNGSAEGNWVEYRHKTTGEHFTNGEGGARDYRSREIHAAGDKKALGESFNVAIREEFPGTEVVA